MLVAVHGNVVAYQDQSYASTRVSAHALNRKLYRCAREPNMSSPDASPGTGRHKLKWRQDATRWLWRQNVASEVDVASANPVAWPDVMSEHVASRRRVALLDLASKLSVTCSCGVREP